MIKYVEGNLLKAPVEALVNTVNTVGVMGQVIDVKLKAQPKITAVNSTVCSPTLQPWCYEL